MQTYPVENHESSLVPDGQKWRLCWADEFDGTVLDTDKWDYRLSMMGKPYPGWTDQGVQLDGQSHAVFTLLADGEGRAISSQLQTGYNFMDTPVQETRFGEDYLQWNIGKLHPEKFTHRYGYFECRCRLQQKEGWWSAFWVQSPVIGASLSPAETGAELDIMESFHPGQVAPHNAFTGGYGLDMKRAIAGRGAGGLSLTEYHRFGMRWDKTGYTFYIDGREDGHIGQYISHRPEFLLISTEPMGYRMKAHQPTAQAQAAIGDTFLVDYVRVFDPVEE